MIVSVSLQFSLTFVNLWVISAYFKTKENHSVILTNLKKCECNFSKNKYICYDLIFESN